MSTAPDAPRNLFERYRPYQRRVLVAIWIAVMALQGAFNSVVAVIDARSAGRDLPSWQPVTWELSSTLALLALVPAVIAFERRFPLHLSTLRRNLLWHLAASVVFSLVHVVSMVALRHLAYAAAGLQYDFGDWRARWPYEYLKDVRTYAVFIGAVLSYRLFMLR
ncbi:MAG: LytTR family transcriptional regulator, partial [Variovorax sp.]